MTPEELSRAGRAVAERIAELGMTVPELACKAGVDPSTVRRLINGRAWPHQSTRDRIMDALEWPRGELARRVWAGSIGLEAIPTYRLVEELHRRITSSEH